MKKFALAVMALSAMTLSAQGPQSDTVGQSVPGELLVQFKAGAAPGDKARALGRINAQVLEVVHGENRGRGELVLAKYQPDLPPAASQRALASDSAVEFAEPNWIYTHQATSNDTYYTNGNLWGMYGGSTSPSSQFGSQAAVAWAAGHNNCGSVYVGIIDEGYMYSHQDLAPNAGTNPGEIAGNGIDDDGNGYVDDVYGWDFDGNNNTVFDGTGDDHGTHVAGTIGAAGGNGLGVAGVCWQVKLMSAKFLGRNGGTTANAVKAVDYFTDLKARGMNLVATNNSWGGGGYSQALFNAIERANIAGILFIAAAGTAEETVSATTMMQHPAIRAATRTATSSRLPLLLQPVRGRASRTTAQQLSILALPGQPSCPLSR